MNTRPDTGTRKPRIAVVSPFLDKRHGTERCVAEQIERLAKDYEIHLYSTAVEDVDLSRIVWHHVPRLPGPYILRFCGWVLANHVCRWWDRHVRKIRYDMVFSPGINCFDADVIAVHIVFAEFQRLAHEQLALRQNPVRTWPRLIHRKLLYRLVIALEKRIYTRTETPLAVISHKMEQDLARCLNRTKNLSLIYHSVDVVHLNPTRRQSLRAEVRGKLQLPGDAFAILIVGNDWKKKGLPCLLNAVGKLHDPNLWILVRGEDASSSCRDLIQKLRLEDRIKLLPSVPQVEYHYAAADLYVGPSVEDSYAFPPLEAMACGVPPIVSSQMGVSEIIKEGVDGFILEDPQDSDKLSELIGLLYRDPVRREQMGEASVKTAQQYTWDDNAALLDKMFQRLLNKEL